jgi:hypothetical protein
MRLGTISLGFGLLCTAAAIALAGEPSFTVRCKHTGGPKLLPKYGTYYFFLTEGQVKGYACSIPGRPCMITNRSATAIGFETPGDDPAKMTIDLRTGSIEHVTALGEHATFACRQIANNP